MSFSIVKLIDPINNVVVTSGLVPKGTYSSSTDYAVGDSVDYNGSSYIMYSDAPSGTLPTDTSYWMFLASKGDTGAAGADGTIITVSAVAPSNPSVNDLWYDIS